MFKFASAPLRAAAALCFLFVLAACGTSSSTSVSSVSITTSTLPAGIVGAVYNATLSATNGTQPYSFVVSSGTLPTGLTLTSAGTIAGVPTAAATSSFTITAQDGTGKQASQPYTLVIAAAPPSPITISPTSLPSGTVATPYTVTLTASGGAAPYTFTLASGSLLNGLTLSTAGVLSGTPTAPGTSVLSINAVDAKGLKATAPYNLTIAPQPLALTTKTLPTGTVGAAYTAAVAAQNGTPPYTFTITSGTAPTGLTLTTTGTLSGTPTISGPATFTITVTDSAAQNASAPFTVTIAAALIPLTFGPVTLSTAIANSAYTTTLQVSGGSPPYTVTQTSGNLPTGLTLTPAGVLSGIATTTGTYTFAAQAADSNSPQQTVSTNFTLSVVTATVAVDTTTVLATVPHTFYGLHTSVYDTALDDTTNLPALLQTTGITTLRYPGGNYSDRYHWAQFGITPPHASTPPVCQDSPQDLFLGAGADFGSFVKTLQATGTQGLITVNYGTSVSNSSGALSPGSTNFLNRCSEPNSPGQPQEAAAWIAYANGITSNTQVIGVDAAGFDWKTVGFWAGLRAASPLATDDGYNFLRIAQTAPVGIRYWEIGNEVYYNGWSQNLNPETDLHAPYIYANGYDNNSFTSRDSNPLLSPTAYGQNAGPFITAMKAVDPTILIGVDFASPGTTDPINLAWNPDLAQSVCTASSIDLAIIHYYPGTYNAVMPSELLSLPQSDLPRQIAGIKANLAQYCPTNASAIQFWLTETSPNGTLVPNFPTPVIGLFTLNEYLTALELGVQNIDWLELHNGTYLDASENPGPSYYTIQLAHLLAGIGDTVVSATSSSPTLLSFATLKTGSSTDPASAQKGVLLLNADPVNPAIVQVIVSGSTLGATATQYSYGTATTQSAPALTGSAFTIPGNTFTVTVPPYTATELLIQ